MKTMKIALSVLVIISYMLIIASAISGNTSDEIYASEQITSTNQTIAESFDSTDETSIHQKIEDPCAKFTLAPLNPEFLEYQNRTVRKDVPLCVGMTDNGHRLGLIPHPVDLSHLGNVDATLTYLGYSDSYDLRSLGNVTPVRDQGDAGSCWAHATYASLESYLLPAETWDFSENNMKNLLSSSYSEGFDRLHSGGGNHLMSTAYLARWSGPINESDDPYNATNGVSPSGLNATKHVQDVLFVPDRDNFSDNDNIKWAIENYGAVYSTMRWNTPDYNNVNYTYYYDDGTYNDYHAIAIVGWNDSFDKNKFSTIPSGNGAFIIKNSWGTGWGENGYFYISYYDSVIGNDTAIFTAEALNNYDYVHQYDPLGWITSCGYDGVTAWAANIFTAQTYESLEAVSFYTTDSNVEYELYIYRDPISGPINTTGPIGTKTGTISLPGYHTISLNSGISINPGQKFSVVVKFTNPTYTDPIAIEYPLVDYSSKAIANTEESYLSSDGTTWTDITATFENTSICIKAFTKKECNPPSASGEMPLNGSLISNTTPLISVNITDYAPGVNASSIVMTINDSIVEISNISLTGGYMVFNQTATPFADDQLINVSVSASDNASNSLTYNWSFTIDTTPPVIASATANPQEIEANGTDNTLLNVTATDLHGIASVTVNLSAIGGLSAQPMINNTGVWQFLTNTTTVGIFKLPVNVTDNAGNSNTSVNISLNATDTTSPVVIDTSPENLATDVKIDSSITATFSEPMNSSTLNDTTVKVYKLATGKITGETFENVNGTWNSSNFQGFSHTEELKIEQAPIDNANRTIVNDSLTYSTQPVPRYYQLYIGKGIEVEGSINYSVIGWLGDEYIAVNGKPEKLTNLVFEQKTADTKTLQNGEIWDLGDGYSLKVIQIESDGNKAWVELYNSSELIDAKVIENQSSYWVKDDIANENDVPFFVTYLNKVTSTAIELKYTWLISQDATVIETGNSFGVFEVTSISSDAIRLTNEENVSLTRGSTIPLVNDLKFEVEDNSTVRYRLVGTGKIKTALGGDISYNSASRTVTFDPVSNLVYSTTYISYITTGVEDLVGNGLIEDYEWEFKTVDYTPPVTPTRNGGGGGGGGTSGEEYENIEFKDVSRVYISANTDASFIFSEAGNDIQSINFKALTSAGYISATIEVLKDTSALVKQAPSGKVYKNMNIWVGKAGYATEHNIENPVIGFKIQKSWIQDNNINENSIKLNRYSDEVWIALPTTRTDEDATFVYFESQTPGFSPFAIAAQEKTISSQVSIKSETAAESLSPVEEQPVETTTPEPEIESVEETSMWGYLLIGALILIVAAGAYLYMRKRQS